MGPLYTSQMTEGQLWDNGSTRLNPPETGFHYAGSHV